MVKKLLMGNEAFACAALEAGVNVAAGYPGTPSSEVIETIAKRVSDGSARGVHVEWSTNEKAALEMLCGASYAGARTLFTCKQMGMNVAADALLSVNYVGVGGGMVLFVADDPGPISSQTEQDTRRFASFAKVPVLDPATPEQGFAMIKAAFELSERYHTPVIVRPTTRVCHASTYFDIQETTQARELPAEGFVKDPKWIIFPRRSYQAHGEIIERLAAAADDFSDEAAFADFNHCFGGNAPTLGIMAGGVSASYVRDALLMLEQRAQESGAILPPYRFMQVGTPYPFPAKAALRFAEGLEHILVFEELDNVIEDEMLKLAGQGNAGFEVLGKITGHTRFRGENSVDDCVARIASFFDAYVVEGEIEDGDAADVGIDVAEGETEQFLELAASRAIYAYQEGETGATLPVRPPVLCAGCPHRGSFYAVKKALGKRKAVYCGDIGCYTLGNAAPLNTTDTCLCMGAGITIAQGFAVVEPDKKQIAFVGDSTFFASGMTGVANAVYNQHDVTIVVLDNATTAMTGSQPHPGTGVTLMGPKSKPISIPAVLEALGVECIVRANPLNFNEARAAAQQAIDFEGPSALVFESPCIQLKRPDIPVVINASTCTGCKKCITEIGCPGIGFNVEAQGPKSRSRGQAFINSTQCNGCDLCVPICPFGSIESPRAQGEGE